MQETNPNTHLIKLNILVLITSGIDSGNANTLAYHLSVTNPNKEIEDVEIIDDNDGSITYKMKLNDNSIVSRTIKKGLPFVK